MSWNLHDFTGDQNSRFNNPELWDDMCAKRYIADVLKENLLNRERLWEYKDQIEWALQIVSEDGDTYCYLEAFLDGLAYRHGGFGRNCVGGAAIEKKIGGRRIVRARPQPSSAASLIH